MNKTAAIYSGAGSITIGTPAITADKMAKSTGIKIGT